MFVIYLRFMIQMKFLQSVNFCCLTLGDELKLVVTKNLVTSLLGVRVNLVMVFCEGRDTGDTDKRTYP